MSQAERYAWLSLLAWAAILFYLLVRFTDGYEILGQSFGFHIVEQPADRLFWTYITLIVIAVVAEAVIAGFVAFKTGKDDIEKDERDHAIEARANLASYWFMAAALNLIVIHVLANEAYPGHNLATINLTNLTGVAFALLFVLTAAEIVKRIATIWNYRRA